MTETCNVWRHEPRRGIVDEQCTKPATGPDGLCDVHRERRKQRKLRKARKQLTKHVNGGTGGFVAYVESLDHKLTQLAGSQPSVDAALEAAQAHIRRHPQEWSEHDSLIVARVLMNIPVELVVMGA